MDMQNFFTKSREGKPATASSAPMYTPPVRTEFNPPGVNPNITGMGRSRRRKNKKTAKKTVKGGLKHRRR